LQTSLVRIMNTFEKMEAFHSTSAIRTPLKPERRNDQVE
jgi:hypothetical protein